MAQLNVNLSDVNEKDAEGGGGVIIPRDRYLLNIVEGEVKRNSKNTGDLFEYKAEVVEGEFAGVKVFGNINVTHQNTTAQKIGQAQLAALAEATGIGKANLTDTDQFLFQPFYADLDVETYEDRNRTPRNAWSRRSSSMRATRTSRRRARLRPLTTTSRPLPRPPTRRTHRSHHAERRRGGSIRRQPSDALAAYRLTPTNAGASAPAPSSSPYIPVCITRFGANDRGLSMAPLPSPLAPRPKPSMPPMRRRAAKLGTLLASRSRCSAKSASARFGTPSAGHRGPK